MSRLDPLRPFGLVSAKWRESDSTSHSRLHPTRIARTLRSGPFVRADFYKVAVRYRLLSSQRRVDPTGPGPEPNGQWDSPVFAMQCRKTLHGHQP